MIFILILHREQVSHDVLLKKTMCRSIKRATVKLLFPKLVVQTTVWLQIDFRSLHNPFILVSKSLYAKNPNISFKVFALHFLCTCWVSKSSKC